MTYFRRPTIAVRSTLPLLGLVLGATLVVGGATPPARADQLAQKQQQHDAISLTIQQLQQEIANSQDQEAALQTIINDLNTQIAQKEADVTAAQSQLDAINAALSNAEDRLKAISDKLASNRVLLSKEMVVSYELGSQANALTAVFGSGDFNQGWERLIAIRRISAAEDALTNDIESEREQVAATVAQIAAQKVQQTAALQQLQDAKARLQVQLESHSTALQFQAQLQAADSVRLQQAEQSAKEVEAQIEQLKAEAAAGGTGQFAWPETGPITQGFGCTPYSFEPYDPSCPSRHFHTGIDIGAPDHTPVGAADGGVAHIYYSSYGYGDHVIIDHGNGFVSVYGHLAAFAVHDGQGVVRGQIIGWEGSTGNSTGSHLHFEIRNDNGPVSPFHYLP